MAPTDFVYESPDPSALPGFAQVDLLARLGLPAAEHALPKFPLLRARIVFTMDVPDEHPS